MKAAAIAAVSGLMFVVCIMAALGSGTSDAAGDPPGGGGDIKTVPAEYQKEVQMAASMCPQESIALIAAQIEAESNWNPSANSGFAQGIAQFTPGTWAVWGQDYNHDGSTSVWDPGDAIPSQGALMCANFKDVAAAQKSGRITNGSLVENALAAYNAGLGAVEASHGFPTGLAETDSYVPKILALEAKYGGGTATGSAGAAIAAAEKMLGLPYVWGGGNTQGPTGYLGSSTPPLGFDCEGLTRYAIYQGYHIDIGVGSRQQLVTPALHTVVMRSAGQPMPLSVMAPGDVVVINFHPSTDGPWGHVALYLGDGKFIHAPTFGKTVEIVPASNFENADWAVRRAS